MTKVGVAGRSSGSKVEEKKKRGIGDGGRRLAAEIIQRVPASAPGKSRAPAAAPCITVEATHAHCGYLHARDHQQRGWQLADVTRHIGVTVRSSNWTRARHLSLPYLILSPVPLWRSDFRHGREAEISENGGL